MSRIQLVRVAVAIAVAAVLAWLILRGPVPGQREMEGELRSRLAGSPPRYGAGEGIERRRTWAMVREFYKERGYRPAWTDINGPRTDAYKVAGMVLHADRDGLDPRAYGAPTLLADLAAARRVWAPLPVRAESLAWLDLRITTALCRYAHDLRDGRFPRGALDPDWGARPDSLGLAIGLARAALDHHVQAMVDTLAPQTFQYRALRDILASYRAVQKGRGWPTIPPGPTLARGDRGWRVSRLRARLAASGDLPSSAGGDGFDAPVVLAVRHFQNRHGISVTGTVGDATRAALNVPAEQRVREIELNMERLRWAPRRLSEPYILVNIPNYKLELINGGCDSLTMRVVVGQPKSPTPVFSDLVTFMVVNPKWTLPKRILVEEVLPALKRNRDYFMEHQLRALSTLTKEPREVPPDSVPWAQVLSDSFAFIVRQDAGPENPLGRIKFMCPNEYDVYLHDTPGRSHFRDANRDLSHGCVRVEDPAALALYLLRGTGLASADSVDSLIGSGAWRQVGFKRSVPVHVVYRTAWADSDGTVEFRPDLYGIDRRMSLALRIQNVSAFELNPKSDWADQLIAGPNPPPWIPKPGARAGPPASWGRGRAPTRAARRRRSTVPGTTPRKGAGRSRSGPPFPASRRHRPGSSSASSRRT